MEVKNFMDLWQMTAGLTSEDALTNLIVELMEKQNEESK